MFARWIMRRRRLKNELDQLKRVMSETHFVLRDYLGQPIIGPMPFDTIVMIMKYGGPEAMRETFGQGIETVSFEFYRS